jgi:hypothetical protein
VPKAVKILVIFLPMFLLIFLAVAVAGKEAMFRRDRIYAITWS